MLECLKIILDGYFSLNLTKIGGKLKFTKVAAGVLPAVLGNLFLGVYIFVKDGMHP